MSKFWNKKTQELLPYVAGEQPKDGVKVIHRTDYNFSEVADYIKDTVVEYALMTDADRKKCRAAAEKLSKKALWSEFIKYYYKAYDIALTKDKP